MSIFLAIVYTIPFFLLFEIFKQFGIDLKDYGIVWIGFLAFGWGFYQGKFVSFSSFNHGTEIWPAYKYSWKMMFAEIKRLFGRDAER